MLKFLVIIEQGPNNYSAYVPDLPGCVATGRTLEEVENNMRGAISLHLEGMMEDNEPIPTSSSLAEIMEVPTPSSAA
jgi:predicted RNase H-like HicB family nuclease